MHHSSNIKLSPFGAQNWLLSEIKRNFRGTYGSQMAVPYTDIFFKFGNLVKRHIVNFNRRRCSTDNNVRFNKINVMFARGPTIWNLLKPKRKSSSFNIDINVLAQHLENIMTDDWPLNSEQDEINSDVDKCQCHRDMKMECGISQTAVANNIRRLKRNCAPGIDGVTTEHMLYALSDTFCTELMNSYSIMLKLNFIPDVLQNWSYCAYS